MNIDMLKGEIKRNAYTQGDVALGIGISLSRFNAKLNSKNAGFTLGEVKSIKNLLNLTIEQCDVIFFK